MLFYLFILKFISLTRFFCKVTLPVFRSNLFFNFSNTYVNFCHYSFLSWSLIIVHKLIVLCVECMCVCTCTHLCNFICPCMCVSVNMYVVTCIHMYLCICWKIIQVRLMFNVIFLSRIYSKLCCFINIKNKAVVIFYC